MRDLQQYFMFYYRLAGKRIIGFTLLCFVSVSLQGLGACFFLPVLSHGQKDASKYNMITEKVLWLLGQFGVTEENTRLLVLLAAASGLFFLGNLMLLGSRLFAAKIGTDIFADLEIHSIKRLFQARYEYYTSKNLGYLTNALIQQTLGVSNTFSFFSTIIINTFLALLFLSLPFLLNPSMAVIAVCAGLIYLPVVRFTSRRIKKYSILNAEQYGELSDIVIQFLSNYKYLKATGTFKSCLWKVKEKTGQICYAIRRLAIWGSCATDMMQPAAVCFISALFYVQVVYMGTSLPDALALLVFLYASYQKAVVVPTAYQKFLSSAGAIMIYQTLDAELDKEIEVSSGVKKIPDFNGPLKFERVSFSYRNNPAKILDEVSFEIAPRTSVAFVGGSGAGKSTIVNMLTGLLQPSEGTLSLSGTPYRELELELIREHIGYVTQESVIFNDSVHNNISLWDQKRSTNDVRLAAEKASAADFIEKMPSSYQSILGDRGVLLSGGQRQRITIARELLRGSPLLILDEATSSLDSATEQEIQHELDAAHGERTVIMIAHRLSTVKNCDRIFVLDSGHIVESGSYDELYKNGGLFRTMVDRQSLGETI